MMKYLCVGAAILTWLLIPFGAYVRLKNAGLSCPDWPLCYGQLIPPAGFEIALETGHRFVATFLGVVIIAITFITFWQAAFFKLRKLAVISLIFVSIQGILGALTVTMVLWPPIVTLHLLGGNILFGILVYLSRVTFGVTEDNSAATAVTGKPLDGSLPFKRHLILMLAVLLILITSGGYNSTTSSGTHCEAFPGCHEGSFVSFGMSGTDISNWSGIKGHILPRAPLEFQGRFFPEFANEWIHMLHRLTALGGGMALMVLSWVWLRNRYGYNIIGNSIILLILLEICVGIANAVFRVPAPISALHTAIAATLTGLLFFVFAGFHLKKEII